MGQHDRNSTRGDNMCDVEGQHDRNSTGTDNVCDVEGQHHDRNSTRTDSMWRIRMWRESMTGSV